MEQVTTVFTVGHGTREIDDFLDLLEEVGIKVLADVRTSPGSRKHPQFGRDALAASTASHGIAYEWLGKELGGFRKARPDSRHTELRSDGFRGYADHMETSGFREALADLIEKADASPTAVMCAESVWWRCHRRMLSDALVTQGCEVLHIMDGKLMPHTLTNAVRVDDGTLVYDVPEEESGQRRLV